MNRKFRPVILTILSVLVTAMAFLATGTEVSAQTWETFVSVTYEGDTTYPMEISISSGGSFIDGTTEIKGGEQNMVYHLTLGSGTPAYKEFTIQPNPGYKLVSLSYTEPEIDPDTSISLMDQIVDGKFSLPVRSTKMIINAIFEQIDDGDGDDSGGGSTGGSGTGSGGTGGSGSGGSSSGSGSSDEDAGSGTGTGGSSGTGSGTQTGASSQAGNASTSGTGTGDKSAAEWYLLLMLTAVAAMAVIAAKKQKNVYKEPE